MFARREKPNVAAPPSPGTAGLLDQFVGTLQEPEPPTQLPLVCARAGPPPRPSQTALASRTPVDAFANRLLRTADFSRPADSHARCTAASISRRISSGPSLGAASECAR